MTSTPGSGAARTHAHVVRNGAVDTCNIGHRHLAGVSQKAALAFSCVIGSSGRSSGSGLHGCSLAGLLLQSLGGFFLHQLPPSPTDCLPRIVDLVRRAHFCGRPALHAQLRRALVRASD
jgi:hypothetical protein